MTDGSGMNHMKYDFFSRPSGQFAWTVGFFVLKTHF